MAPTKGSQNADVANNTEGLSQEEEEDSPIIKELKEIDDRYLALHKEYEKAVQALQSKYTEIQRPILEDRRKLLLGQEEQTAGPMTGTPALKGFWLQALQNHPEMDGAIEDHDFPVLEYIQNIATSNLDPDDSSKGFRLSFHFSTNPFFENAVLSKEFHTREACPYREEIEVTEIIASSITWKPGKDVTVEMVKKPAKGKKSKAAKATEESRPSFFRDFFKSMKLGGPLPDDVDGHEIAMAYGDRGDFSEDELVKMLLETAYELGETLKDQVVPFAVRWYTGEAAPDEDDDLSSGEDEDDDDDDDDDEDEDESEDEEDKKPAKGKKRQPKGGLPTGDKKEECKQQ